MDAKGWLVLGALWVAFKIWQEHDNEQKKKKAERQERSNAEIAAKAALFREEQAKKEAERAAVAAERARYRVDLPPRRPRPFSGLYLSPRRVAHFRVCPRRYELLYLKGLATNDIDEAAAAYGTGVHRVIEAITRHAVEHGHQFGDANYISQLPSLVDHALADVAIPFFDADSTATAAITWYLKSQMRLPAVYLIEHPFQMRIRHENAVASHAVCGVPDLVVIRGSSVRVDEFKSGSGKRNPEWLLEAQTRHYAYLALHHANGQHGVRVQSVDTEVWLLGSRERVPRSYTVTELNAYGVEVARTSQAITLGRFEPTPSASACRHCPVREQCPDRWPW